MIRQNSLVGAAATPTTTTTKMLAPKVLIFNPPK